MLTLDALLNLGVDVRDGNARCPSYRHDMEELRLIFLFQWGRNLLAVAFIIGMFVAQDTTTRFVLALITQHGATIAERMERALEPVLAAPSEEDTDAGSSRGERSRISRRGVR